MASAVLFQKKLGGIIPHPVFRQIDGALRIFLDSGVGMTTQEDPLVPLAYLPACIDIIPEFSKYLDRPVFDIDRNNVYTNELSLLYHTEPDDFTKRMTITLEGKMSIQPGFFHYDETKAPLIMCVKCPNQQRGQGERVLSVSRKMQTQEGGLVLFRVLDIRLADNLVVTFINCDAGYDFSIITSTMSNYPASTNVLALYHQKNDETKIKKEFFSARGDQSMLETRFSVEGVEPVISSRRRGKRARKKAVQQQNTLSLVSTLPTPLLADSSVKRTVAPLVPSPYEMMKQQRKEEKEAKEKQKEKREKQRRKNQRRRLIKMVPVLTEDQKLEKAMREDEERKRLETEKQQEETESLIVKPMIYIPQRNGIASDQPPQKRTRVKLEIGLEF